MPVHYSSEEPVIDRSALCDMSEPERLHQLVSKHKSAIKTLTGELEAATETMSNLQIACATNEKLTSEVAALKMKRFWQLNTVSRYCRKIICRQRMQR